eukprot:TRINITY_DN2522_c0_g1_i1.p1 TRINITY_DN2522_c0_g1~~TRINITY_DN2522_c0_g1_i1.p1  ORF type:complete len:454 (-),score=140.90 TRINITY_DN2522_c0_g1_i1:164-1525(-)
MSDKAKLAKLLPTADSVLKNVKKYLQTAVQLDKVDPLVAYHCRLYAVTQASAIKQGRSKEDTKLILGLMDWLESQSESRAVSKEDAQAHCESFANNVFTRTDNDDRAGKTNKQTALGYHTAYVLLDMCRQFGELSPELTVKLKYALRKTTDIFSALREGRTPKSGPLDEDTKPDNLDAELNAMASLKPTSTTAPSANDEKALDPSQFPTPPSRPFPSSAATTSSSSSSASSTTSASFSSYESSPTQMPPSEADVLSSPSSAASSDASSVSSSASLSFSSAPSLSSPSSAPSLFPPSSTSSLFSSSAASSVSASAPPPLSASSVTAPSSSASSSYSQYTSYFQQSQQQAQSSPRPSKYEYSAPSSASDTTSRTPHQATNLQSSMSSLPPGALIVTPSKTKMDRIDAGKEAEKLIRHAASALNFDDFQCACDRLQSALSLLLPHRTDLRKSNMDD